MLALPGCNVTLHSSGGSITVAPGMSDVLFTVHGHLSLVNLTLLGFDTKGRNHLVVEDGGSLLASNSVFRGSDPDFIAFEILLAIE